MQVTEFLWMIQSAVYRKREKPLHHRDSACQGRRGDRTPWGGCTHKNWSLTEQPPLLYAFSLLVIDETGGNFTAHSVP